MQTSTRLRRKAGSAVRRLRRTPSDSPTVGTPEAAGSELPSGSSSGAPQTSILIVNGFDRRGERGRLNEEEAREFPWIELCLRQIERHSRSSSYEVLVWDNSWIPEHRRVLRRDPRVKRFKPRDESRALRHAPSLNRLVQKVRPETEFIITLDSDSFPIRDGWIENLTGRLSDDVWLAGVWRDEMVPRKPPFIHPCGLAVRRERLHQLGVGFAKGSGADVGFNLTEAAQAAGARVSTLRRSNYWNPHFLMGAIYGDMIYHQGAGSRAPKFSADSDPEHDEEVRQVLRNVAFSDLDDLLDALAGNADPESVDSLARLHALTRQSQLQP